MTFFLSPFVKDTLYQLYCSFDSELVLHAKTGIEDQSHIVSLKQAELLTQLPLSHLIMIKDNYKLMSSSFVINGVSSASKLQKLQDELLQLKSKDKTKYDLLFGSNAIEAYETGQCTFADLKDLYPQEIPARILFAFAKAYSSGTPDLEACKKMTPKKIEALTSDNVILAYQTGRVTVADLKDLELEKIEALTSQDARFAYEIGKCTLADLKDLELEKIKSLTSLDSISTYQTGQCTPADLKDLSEKKIKSLTSRSVRLAYQTGQCTLADLKDLELEKIEALTSRNARSAYSQDKITQGDFKTLIKLEATQIEAVISGAKQISDFIPKEPAADKSSIEAAKAIGAGLSDGIITTIAPSNASSAPASEKSPEQAAREIGAKITTTTQTGTTTPGHARPRTSSQSERGIE